MVSTPGPLRLALELFFFAAAAWSLHAAGLRVVAFLFVGVVILHYGISYDRIIWLLSKRVPERAEEDEEV
jgi:hypothetical protein